MNGNATIVGHPDIDDVALQLDHESLVAHARVWDQGRILVVAVYHPLVTHVYGIIELVGSNRCGEF